MYAIIRRLSVRRIYNSLVEILCGDMAGGFMQVKLIKKMWLRCAVCVLTADRITRISLIFISAHIFFVTLNDEVNYKFIRKYFAE